MNQSEYAVIGGLCHGDNWVRNEPKLIEAMNTCSTKHFSTQEGQLIYSAVVNVLGKGFQPDLMTISDEINGKPIEIGSWFCRLGEIVKNTPSCHNIVEHSKNVRDEYNAKSIYSFLNQAAEALNDRLTQSPRARIKNALEVISGISLDSTEKWGYSSKEALNVLIDKLEWLAQQDGDISGVDTGFARLNQITSGLQKKAKYVIAAQNGVGKTTLCMNILESAAFMNNKNCLFYSLEMPIDRVMMKFGSSLTNVHLSKFLSGGVLSDDDSAAKFTAAMPHMMKDNLIIDDKPISVGELEIRTKSHELRLGGQIDLIVIDYFGLIRSKGFGEEHYTNIAAAIDELCKKFDCPVVTIAQLTKTFQGKPTRKDVRNGGRLCDDADFVGLLWRDTQIGEELKDGDVLTFAVDKNRYGPITAFGFESSLSCSKLIECEKPEEIEEVKPTRKRKDFFSDVN